MSDVAFTTYIPGDGGHVEVLFNQGDGTLAAPPTQPVTQFVFFPGPIVATDLNGDGLPDLAVHSTENPIVLAFLNEGAGVLSAPISSVGGSAALYWDAQAADLNGDGLPDLAVPVHGGVDVLQNQGGGTFGTPDHHDESGQVLLDDLNGDGAIDLLARGDHADTLSVRLNQGNGAFAPAQTYRPGRSPVAFVTADLDGDGREDIAAALDGDNEQGNGVEILRNQGGGAFVSSPVDHGLPPHPGPIAAGDLDGDGALDLVVLIVDLDGGPGVVRAFENHGGGTFADDSTDIAPGFAPTSIAVADVNGDGLSDVVGTSISATTLSRRGPERRERLLLGPDGRPEWLACRLRRARRRERRREARYRRRHPKVEPRAAAVTVLFNQGGGAFSAPAGYGTASGSNGSNVSVALGDMNADGELDIVAEDVNQVVVLLNDGSGGFGAPVVHANPHGGKFDSIALGDLNGDGLADLAVAPHGGDTLSLFFNQGVGVLGPEVSYPMDVFSSTVAIADMNADSLPDLVVTREAIGRVSVLWNQGSGDFTEARDYPAGTTDDSSATSGNIRFGVVVADLNADGHPDLAVTDPAYATMTVLLATCMP